MKLLCISIFVGLSTLHLSAQVGINTTNPQETLHVVGTARIETTNQTGVTTTKISGLDNSGTIREINIGSNFFILMLVPDRLEHFIVLFGKHIFWNFLCLKISHIITCNIL